MAIVLEEKQILAFAGKGRTPRSPDWIGHLMIDGIQYQIMLWEGVTKKGNSKLSGRIMSPEEIHHGWDEPKDEDLPYSPSIMFRKNRY